MCMMLIVQYSWLCVICIRASEHLGAWRLEMGWFVSQGYHYMFAQVKTKPTPVKYCVPVIWVCIQS